MSGCQQGLDTSSTVILRRALVVEFQGVDMRSAGIDYEALSASLYKRRDGSVLVGFPGSIGILDTNTDELKWYTDVPMGLSDNYVTDFEEDVNGNVWALTSNGVYVFNDERSLARAHVHPLITTGGNRNLAPIDIHIDRAGNVWVGTVWGLYRYSPHAKRFGHLEHDDRDPNSLTSGLIVSLAEDGEKNLWVGTIGGGLNRIEHGNGRITSFTSSPGRDGSLSHDVVWALTSTPDGTIWAGTSWGINRFDSESELFSDISRRPGWCKSDSYGNDEYQ